MNSNRFTDLDHLHLVAGRLSDAGIDITTSYSEWVNVTMACATLGEAAREDYHTICRQYPKYNQEECDAKFDNCLKTGRGLVQLGTLIQMAKDHGVDTSLPRGRRPKTKKEKAEERANRFKLAMERLSGMYELRYNTWTQRVEIREDGSDWRNVEDRDIDTIFCMFQNDGINIRQNEVRALINSRDFVKDYDVVSSYLNGLKPWNPDTDPDYIGDFFCGHLEFNDPENEKFYDTMLRKWFVCMVALWMGKVSENPLMPVFCGNQHIGKTFFIRHILPPELRKYFREPNPREPIGNDYLITLSQMVMIFLDEFSISSALKSDTYKAIITSTQLILRAPYGHYSEIRVRKASLIGATNHMQFIRDVEGNRRFVGIDLKGTVDLEDFPLPYEGAYAQAIYLLEHGFTPKPSQEESQLISEHNHSYMEPNDCQEALLTVIRKPIGVEAAEALSAGDIMRSLNYSGFRGRECSAAEIGKTMKRLGFESKLIRGIRKYLVVKVDPQAHENENKKDAYDFGPDVF